MTVCAAGINQLRRPGRVSEKSIMVVTDTKFSWGDMSTEAGWKMQTIHPRWRVLFAGPLSPLDALMDAVRTEVANVRNISLRPFARLCSRAYRTERKNIIETEILAEHDLDTYTEYQALKNSAIESDRVLFGLLGDKIKNEEQNWNLLFVGFDDTGRPHIFVITEFGKIQYCDTYGFAVIGSGCWPAQYTLGRFGFNKNLSRGEAAYALLAAKFAAESADGVGENTAFMMLKADDRMGRTVSGLNTDDIAAIKAKWNGLALIPSGAPQLLEARIAQGEREPRIKIDNPLRGYLRRSMSRKLKRVR